MLLLFKIFLLFTFINYISFIQTHLPYYFEVVIISENIKQLKNLV